MELILIPTAHISKKSIQQVIDTINLEKPDIIAVELDKQRAIGLLQNKKPNLLVLLKNPGFLFMYSAQQIIGLIFKSKPGEEMKTALVESGKHKIPILLADMPISKTIENMKKIPFREKIKMFAPVKINGINSIDKLTDPDKLRPILEQIKIKYPKTYQFLLEERNQFIFDKLISCNYLKIVGVFGAGHIPGLIDLINQYNINNKEKIINFKIVR
ncbi:TraB/GumN family protein [Candidatus Micrarchaeota archaeon]|jgi:pheromone shutdown protein TraB|nr:TraB/GumN family protein [Candidatus Micrarchaeota archaeon]